MARKATTAKKTSRKATPAKSAAKPTNSAAKKASAKKSPAKSTGKPADKPAAKPMTAEEKEILRRYKEAEAKKAEAKAAKEAEKKAKLEAAAAMKTGYSPEVIESLWEAAESGRFCVFIRARKMANGTAGEKELGIVCSKGKRYLKMGEEVRYEVDVLTQHPGKATPEAMASGGAHIHVVHGEEIVSIGRQIKWPEISQIRSIVSTKSTETAEEPSEKAPAKSRKRTPAVKPTRKANGTGTKSKPAPVSSRRKRTAKK